MAITETSTPEASSAARSIAAHWWVPLLRGLVSIGFGIVVFAFPVSAIGVFVLIFGGFVFADGVLAIVQALRSAQPRSTRWWMHLAAGIAGILIGVLTFVLPAITALTLAVFISSWAIVTGVLEIIAGVHVRRHIAGEIYMILGGVLSVALGVIVFFFPLVGLLGAAWIIGAYGLMSGIALVILGLRLRKGDIARRG